MHKFQGWETSWKKSSGIHYLLVDIGSIDDETRAPGTCYAALSRPHTVGDITSHNNLTSALYWIGNDICFNRIRNIGLTKTGEQTSFVKSRTLWVDYLKERKENTDKWISEKQEIWHTMYDENIANKALTNRQLETNIMNRLEILNSSFI